MLVTREVDGTAPYAPRQGHVGTAQYVRTTTRDRQALRRSVCQIKRTIARAASSEARLQRWLRPGQHFLVLLPPDPSAEYDLSLAAARAQTRLSEPTREVSMKAASSNKRGQPSYDE
jgi:hypothetical protein